MAALRERIGEYARADATTPVCGETGTGKERVARALKGSSPRATRAFVAVDSSALPSELGESELFGNALGACTGAVQTRGGLLEAADGGAPFLDEVAELLARVQGKLLQVLEDGAYRPLGACRELKSDVRIVAVTHRGLPAPCAKRARASPGPPVSRDRAAPCAAQRPDGMEDPSAKTDVAARAGRSCGPPCGS